MPAQFSYNKIKMKRDVLADTQDGEPKEFYGSAFLQYKTDYDQDTGRFEPMTDEQKAIIDELWEACHDAGVELSISLFERTGSDFKDWPKVFQFSLRVNDPER